MTDEQQSNETEAAATEQVEAPADEAGEAVEAEPEQADAEEGAQADREDGDEKDDGGDEDDGGDKDDDDKDDKPKKVKISYEASMPRSEAVSYFEAIVGGLRSGRLEFRQEGDALVLNPPEQLEIEVKAQRKGDKGKVVFEIEWSDEHRPLEILN